MSQDRLTQLLSRKLANEATIQELEELDRLLLANPEWKRLVDQLLEHDLSCDPNDDPNNAEAAWAAHATNMYLASQPSTTPKRGSNLKLQTSNLKQKKRVIVTLSLSITTAILLAAGWWFFSRKPARQLDTRTNEIVTKRGSLSFVKLPDGTQVWLNTNTRLIYNGDFSGPQREVTLSGEAYFDVTHDSKRPFLIHTGKLNIKVLGTAFNVKSYPKDETQEAALIRGKIEVTLNDRPQEKIILHPSEKFVVNNNNRELKVSRAGKPTLWLENKIEFTDESLLNISHILERRFDVSFQFNNEELKTWSYTGIYETESLEKILELLSVSQKFNYSIKDQQVIISKQ